MSGECIDALTDTAAKEQPVNYKLDGHKAIPVSDPIEWARWFERADRKVAQVDVGDVHVSTVFLSIDHSFGRDGPILFETMVFGGELDQEQDRYRTWEEAEVGHAKMVARVLATQEPDDG